MTVTSSGEPYIPPAVLQAAHRWSWTPNEGFWASGRTPCWVPQQDRSPAWPWLGTPPRREAPGGSR